MPAKYLFYKNPHSPSQKEEEGVLHARIVEGQVLRFDKLCRKIADRTTFNEGEVKGMMATFKEELVQALKDGDSVEIEGIGLFSVTAKCPPIRNPKEIRAESIQFSKVTFRACKELKKEMSSMHFERASDYRRKDAYTPQQRQERILRYLSNHRDISSSDCMGVNVCSRYIAQGDLKQLREEKRIVRLGGPKIAVYVLPEKGEAE
ncbi:HU family DNA-binding protein [Parabacteroides timonensis]|uniref:HU family DNA-binding protein n=1 Tax=Parabacteroides timonensis TaxID=1871013 RepID=UPI00094E223F|nr:HU family DNA-binding protein [Parabacteroides timonensis]